MNAKQRRILISAAAVVVAMLIYPPFNVAGRVGGESFRGLHYGWIFDSPGGGYVDVGLLFAQWVAVGLVGAIAFVLSANKK
jgi:hypothetical protein